MSEENEMNNTLGLLFSKMPDAVRVHVETCNKCAENFEAGFLKIMDELKKDTRMSDWLDNFLKSVENHVGNIINDETLGDKS